MTNGLGGRSTPSGKPLVVVVGLAYVVQNGRRNQQAVKSFDVVDTIHVEQIGTDERHQDFALRGDPSGMIAEKNWWITFRQHFASIRAGVW